MITDPVGDGNLDASADAVGEIQSPWAGVPSMNGESTREKGPRSTESFIQDLVKVGALDPNFIPCRRLSQRHMSFGQKRRSTLLVNPNLTGRDNILRSTEILIRRTQYEGKEMP